MKLTIVVVFFFWIANGWAYSDVKDESYLFKEVNDTAPPVSISSYGSMKHTLTYGGGSIDDNDDDYSGGFKPFLGSSLFEQGVFFVVDGNPLRNLLMQFKQWLISSQQEPVDDGGGSGGGSGKSANSDSPSQEGNQPAAASVGLCSRFFAYLSSFCGRRDDDDNDPPTNTDITIVAQCQATALTCNPEQSSGDSDSTESDSTESDSTESDSTESEVKDGAAINVPQGYVLIMNDVYRGTAEADTASGLQPGQNQEVIFIRRGNHYIAAMLTYGEGYQCDVCFSLFIRPQIINCGAGHVYCEGCIQPQCPTCREPVNNPHLDQRLWRQISNLELQCPWCHQNTPLSEVAAHLNHCDNQHESCVFCSEFVSSALLGAHLQRCLNTHSVNDVPEGRQDQVIRQMAICIGNAIFPETLEQISQRVIFADGTVLEPVPNVQELFMRPGADQRAPEFFARLDLVVHNLRPSDRSRFAQLLDKEFLYAEDLIFHVRGLMISTNSMISTDSRDLELLSLDIYLYGSLPIAPRNWVVELLDYEGKSIRLERIAHTSLQKLTIYNQPESRCVFYIYKEQGAFGDYIGPGGEFWQLPVEQRVLFIKVYTEPFGSSPSNTNRTF